MGRKNKAGKEMTNPDLEVVFCIQENLMPQAGDIYSHICRHVIQVAGEEERGCGVEKEKTRVDGVEVTTADNRNGGSDIKRRNNLEGKEMSFVLMSSLVINSKDT